MISMTNTSQVTRLLIQTIYHVQQHTQGVPALALPSHPIVHLPMITTISAWYLEVPSSNIAPEYQILIRR